MTFDGEKWILEVETREGEQKEQEEQWSLRQQQEQQQQSPEASPPAWLPPAPAEFKNDYSDSGGGFGGEKGWFNALFVKINY